jgi:CrcB protein
VTWQSAGLVALGGAIGSVLRWALVLLAAHRVGPGFPWGTLAVNVAGSFAIGVVAELAAGGALSPPARIFLATGILGGFTTFSAFSLETLLLARDGLPLSALVYSVGSVVVGLGAAYVGTLLARAIAHV